MLLWRSHASGVIERDDCVRTRSWLGLSVGFCSSSELPVEESDGVGISSDVSLNVCVRAH
jgi:hypothetical protein